jgi:hypothetical protein
VGRGIRSIREALACSITIIRVRKTENDRSFCFKINGLWPVDFAACPGVTVSPVSWDYVGGYRAEPGDDGIGFLIFILS